MWHNLNRIPIPLMLALAVAMGVTVTIVIQITVLAPIPAVVAPIETSATSLDTGSATYTTSIDVPAGYHAVYPTLGGMGRLRLQSNTTGWYYLQTDWFVTVVRRSTGDTTFTLSNGYKVYVIEINTTHAFIFYEQYSTGVVARKVQVGTTGWYVYHPVTTAYDTTVTNAIRNFLNSLGYSFVNVFQPRPDYVTYDPNARFFSVYFDVVNNDGMVYMKNFYYTNATSFTPVPTTGHVTVSGIEMIDVYNYVLFPVWTLLYYNPGSSSVKSALTVTPT
jgi:hypothetical protein